MMKTRSKKKLSKKDREKAVLFGLVELFIKTNRPIGSSLLQEKGFDFLSSATIRNYFAKLEKKGFLTQQHSSGGRIPTPLAYKEYATHHINLGSITEKEDRLLKEKLKKETREVNLYLQQAAEALSERSGLATFISMPRFDQDFVQNVKLFALDRTRLLCILITDFGQIRPEIILTNLELDEYFVKNLESFFLWRLNKISKPPLLEGVLKQAQRIYNEVMLRNVTNLNLNIYKAGLSKLLAYEEFQDTSLLTNFLLLTEDISYTNNLLKEAALYNDLRLSIEEGNLVAITIPYRINQTAVGAVALLGPLRLNYRHLFGLLRAFSDYVTESLTQSVYKFKITFKPKTSSIMLEDKSVRNNNAKKR